MGMLLQNEETQPGHFVLERSTCGCNAKKSLLEKLDFAGGLRIIHCDGRVEWIDVLRASTLKGSVRKKLELDPKAKIKIFSPNTVASEDDE